VYFHAIGNREPGREAGLIPLEDIVDVDWSDTGVGSAEKTRLNIRMRPPVKKVFESHNQAGRIYIYYLLLKHFL
jgi:hypothetical protein